MNPTKYCGIDLAANPKFTGLAILAQRGDTLHLESITLGIDDEHIINAVQHATQTGVDVPVGWPKPFVEFIAAQAQHTLAAPESTDGPWRKTLAMRATDIDVHRRTGITPLSVSTNLLAYPAFRWAGIEAHLRQLGLNVARDGSGIIAEVYPAAALHRWNIPHTGYKGARNQATRQHILTALAARFPELEFNDYESLMLADDNALDALLSALVAHLITAGQCEGPPEELRELALVEGWIWIPAPNEKSEAQNRTLNPK